jgi:hypothetical protein
LLLYDAIRLNADPPRSVPYDHHSDTEDWSARGRGVKVEGHVVVASRGQQPGEQGLKKLTAVLCKLEGMIAPGNQRGGLVSSESQALEGPVVSASRLLELPEALTLQLKEAMEVSYSQKGITALVISCAC